MALQARHSLDFSRKDGIGLLFIHRPRAVSGAISLVGSSHPKLFQPLGPPRWNEPRRWPVFQPRPHSCAFDRSFPCRNADFGIFMIGSISDRQLRLCLCQVNDGNPRIICDATNPKSMAIWNK